VTKSINKSLIEIQKFKSHSQPNLEKAISRYTKYCEKATNEIGDYKIKFPDYKKEDPILEQILSIYDGKVGRQLTKEEIKTACDKARARCEEKIPPGFRDGSKDINKYGDVIIWFQLIEKSKSDAKPITFITDDKKDDWWYSLHGETVGPHPQLLNEFQKETNQKIYIYRSLNFLQYASERFGEKVDKAVEKEIEYVREQAFTPQNYTNLLKSLDDSVFIRNETTGEIYKIENPNNNDDKDSINALTLTNMKDLIGGKHSNKFKILTKGATQIEKESLASKILRRFSENDNYRFNSMISEQKYSTEEIETLISKINQLLEFGRIARDRDS
jgi:hypothetical protein